MEKNKKKLILQTAFLLFLIIGTVVIVSQQHTMPYQKDTGFIFGTVYNISYQSDKNLKAELEAEMRKVDNSLSPFNKQSVISKINRNEDVEADRMFTDVFTLARRISDDTDGAFDITVAPLVNAWGFGFKNDTKPTRHAIDSLRQLVGYEKVRMAGGRIIKKDKRTMLDCSAIAKGYACDVVADFLRKRGITNREIQTVLNVTNKAMATSGNYRNFYYKNGKKYAHTIDPKTGYPVQHNILSATVLAADCATADAYATAFMVMGLDGAKDVLKKHPELMAYFIYSDDNGNNAVWFSPSMRDKIIE